MSHGTYHNRVASFAAIAAFSLIVGGGLLPTNAAHPRHDSAAAQFAAASSALVAVEGTVVAVAGLPEDAHHLFIETAPGLTVPLDPDSLPAPIAPGQSVAITVEVPRWVVAEAPVQVPTADDGGLPRLLDATDAAGEVLLATAVELGAALDITELSVLANPVLTPSIAAAPHVVDIAFLSKDGRGKFYGPYEITLLLGTLSDWWARETNGEIPAFEYSYADARAAQSTVQCSVDLEQIALVGAGLFGHTSYGPYTGPGARRHLVVLSPADERGAGCPDSYTGAAFLGSSGLASGGVSHIITSTAESSRGALIHEIGHNLSLQHASAGTCPARVVDAPLEPAGQPCTAASNYADDFNIEGAAASWGTTGLNGFQKTKLGLLTKASPQLKVIDTVGSQDVTLRDVSRASGSGVEALQVVETVGATKRDYWIEYNSGAVHVRRGYRAEDPTLPYPVGNVAETWVLSPEGSGPSTTQRFTVGQGFSSDGGGLKFRVDQVTSDQARVHVELGAAPTPSISLSQSSWSPAGGSSNVRLTVTTNRSWWSATSDEPWVTALPIHGGNGAELSLSASGNTTGAPRSAIITVAAGGASARVTVTQAAQEPSVSLAYSSWWPGAEASSNGVRVSTNQATWSASSDQSWMTMSPATGANGEIMWVSVTPNTSTTARSGTVTVVVDGARATLPVTQEAFRPSLKLTPSSWSTGVNAGSTGVIVETNLPSWSASSNQSWLTVLSPSGTTGQTMTVWVDANTSTLARTGTVSVTANGTSTLLTVTQTGVTESVSLSPSWWSAGGQAGSQTVVVSTNRPLWTASSNQSWLTLSPTLGLNGQTMTLQVAANLSPFSRSAVVTVVAGGAKSTLAVVQAPGSASVSLSPPSWSPSGESDSTQVWITTNQASWSASSNQSWLTATPSYGANGQVLSLSVSANPVAAPRSATVTVVAGGASATVSVTQAAGTPVEPSVQLPFASWEAPATPESLGVVVSTNQASWSASSNQSWLTLSSGTGQSGQTLTVSVPASTVSSPRSATVTVTAGGASATLSVVQAGMAPSVTLPFTSWWSGTDAASTGVVVSTNQSSWSASSNQSWLTVSPSNGANGATMWVYTSANASGLARTATVTVTAGGATATLSVTQAAGASVSLSQSLWSPGTNAASTGAVVSTNQSSWSASSNQAWLSVAPSTGPNGGTLTVAVSENTSTSARSGTVTVRAGGALATLSVTQAVPSSCTSFASACSWNLSPVVVSPAGATFHYLKFTAPVSGVYTFESSGRGVNSDPYGALYAADQSQITYNDDGAGNLEFRITAPLIAGQVYYLAARHYSSIREGSFTVSAQVPGS